MTPDSSIEATSSSKLRWPKAALMSDVRSGGPTSVSLSSIVVGLPSLSSYATQPIESLVQASVELALATVGAFAIVLDGSGKVLLAHRTDREAWNLPGGRVERGESPAVAVVREAREEVGLRIAPLGLVGIHFVQSKSDLVLTFLCRWSGEQPRPVSECDAVAWFEVASLPATTLPRHSERISEARLHPSWARALTPDPSIERAASGRSRLPPVAAHVERQAPRSYARHFVSDDEFMARHPDFYQSETAKVRACIRAFEREGRF